MPMGAQGVTFGGPPVGAPPGSYPGDGAWANVSEVNPPGASGGYDREERRQERQRAQQMRDAEVVELDQQLEALRAESDRDLERILAMTREDAREIQEEQFRQDMHAGIIASKQHEMWEYQQGREQTRQRQGSEYRVNMVHELQLFVPQSSSTSTSLSDLQEQLRSPVSFVEASVQGIEPEEVTSPMSNTTSRRTPVRRLGWERPDEHAVTSENSRSRAIARRRRSRSRGGMQSEGLSCQRLLE